MGVIKEPEGTETLMDCIEAAVAAHRRRTAEPDYVEPEDYVPKPPPVIRRDYDDPNRLTVEKAFAWIDQADAYTRDRLSSPSINARQLQKLWDDDYSYRYAPRKEPFPAEHLAKHQLSLLQWRDVLQQAKIYINRHEMEEAPGEDKLAPYGMLIVLAKKFAKNKDASAWRRNKAVVFLNQMHIFVGHMTIEQRTEIKQRVIDAHKYPRTYL